MDRNQDAGRDRKEPESRTGTRSMRAADMIVGIFDSAPIGYCLLGQDGLILDINFRAGEMLGLPRTRLTGDLLPRHVAPECRGLAERHFNQVLTSGLNQTCELRLPGAASADLYVQVHSSLVRGADGKPLCLSALTDITEARLQEGRLKKSEAFFESLFKFSPQLISLTSIADGRYLEANDAFVRTTGYAREELIGRSSLELNIWRHPQDRAEAAQAVREHGALYNREVEYLGKGGRRIVGLTSMVKVDPGVGECLLTLVVDVTDRVMALDELRRSQDALIQAKVDADAANQAKGHFLAHMSHEIRTPISGVLSMLDSLEENAPRPDQAEYLTGIREATQSMLDVLNDILDLSRIEAGRLDLDTADFDPVEAGARAVRIFQAQASRKGIRLEYHPDPACPAAARGDSRRLGQVLRNLIGNAVKFTDCGGVEVSLRAEEENADSLRLRYTVKDTGLGIPQERLSGLFESYNQLEAARSRKFGGSGLGLAISRKLVEMMGGEIGVRSQEGNGSEFSFTIRAARSARSARPDQTPGRPSARPLRLLVAEDNPINSAFLGRYLRKAGHEMTMTENGARAVQAAQAQSFDAILMDIQMPVLNGEDAAREIWRIRQEAGQRAEPIVALTAFALPGDRERLLTLGFAAYLPKPLDVEELLHVLRTLTGAPASAGAGAALRTLTAPTLAKASRAGASGGGTPPLDLEYIVFRLGREPEAFLEMLTLYRDSVPQWIAGLRAHAADGQELATVLHSVANGSGVIRAARVLDLAHALEHACRTGHPDQARQGLDELCAALETSGAAVDSLIRAQTAPG